MSGREGHQAGDGEGQSGARPQVNSQLAVSLTQELTLLN